MLARGIAVIADAVQICLAPVFAEGAVSPFDDALDLLVGCLLIYLLGFNYAFVPSFFIKLLPIADEAPTWTIAVFFATRGRQVLEPARPAELNRTDMDAK